jgi:hypothetical protein
MEYPATRSEAKATGATHYFTGMPCKRGHVASRLTKGTCTVCRKEDWVIENERRKLLPKSDAAKAAGRRYYLRNTELVKARAQARPAVEKRKHKRKYKKKNPEIYRVLVNSRRRRLKDACPLWITADDKRRIREMYAGAALFTKNTGVKYEVDHIIPINSDDVCGLHVPWNLQVLTKSENGHKSNTVTS